MASLNTYSLTIITLLALSLITVSSTTTKPAVISTTSKYQVACTMCDSCDNPCLPAPVYPPPPPPPEILCPPPPPPPKLPECPPPLASPICSDCTPCNDSCSPPATVGPYPHPPPQPGVIGGAVYSPPYGGVNPYFPYTPYKTPPSDQSEGNYQFRFSSVVHLLCFGLAAICFF